MQRTYFSAFVGLLLVCIASCGFGRTPADGLSPSDTIYDFLVMKVCTGPNGDLTTADPLHCPAAQQRNLRAGETVPCYHADFGVPGGPITCADQSTSRRYAFPLDIEGVDQTGAKYPLIVGWTNYPPSHTSCTFNQPNSRDTMTMLTVEGGWGTNLGSRSSAGYVVTEGSGYLDGTTAGVARMHRTWAFPEKLPATGQVDYGIFLKHTQVLGKDVAAIAKFPAHNAKQVLARTFEAWTRLDFQFGAANEPTAALDTLLEIGTPKSLLTDDVPGESRGSEHLYLTRAFGYVTRWEDWQREDQPGTVARAQKAYAQATCTAPANFNGHISPHFTLSPVIEDKALGAWKQELTTTVGELATTHTWYMSGCHDFTNVHAQAPFIPGSVII